MWGFICRIGKWRSVRQLQPVSCDWMPRRHSTPTVHPPELRACYHDPYVTRFIL
jgi:hypothetical protein